MKPSDYFSKHNLTSSNLVAVEKQSANLVYLTDNFVLRVVRPELIKYIDHAREAKLGLKAFNLGLRTAKPIAWDATYSIWERLPGQPLKDPRACPPHIWTDLLGTLELLHDNPLEPLENPVDAWTGDASLVEKTQELAHWTDDEKEQLNTLLYESHVIKSPCFIHGDAYADNIMVNEGHFVGLIDWGNAGWQALEAECSSMDTPALNLALSRWYDLLDISLLWKMRLNLTLEVTSYGRIPVSEVRAVMRNLGVSA